MKINEKYEIQVAVVVLDRNGYPTNCYNNMEDMWSKEGNNCDYHFVFVLIDTETGYIPEYCSEDWFETADDAYWYYRDFLMDDED